MRIVSLRSTCLIRYLGRCALLLMLLPAVAPAASVQGGTPPAVDGQPAAIAALGSSVAQPPVTDTLAVRIAPSSAQENLNLAANPRTLSGLYYSGLLQKALGLSPDSPIKIGGIFDAGGNWLASGGLKPDSTAGDFVLGLGADVDMERLFRIPGAELLASFLDYQGANSNGQAGSVQLYDNLAPAAEFHRLQLYELWWRQRLFHDMVIIKIGKMNATGEFNQVLNPVPIPQTNMQDWTISDLLYASAGLNPTLFGRLPTYPNPAWGATISFLPSKDLYLSYGLFDGNGARGVQTGSRTWPEFNRYKFHILEFGYAWRLRDQGKPGRFGAGVWRQTGALYTGDGTTTNGATGFYAFASQRLWYRDPGIDPSGLIGFLQFGYTNSPANIVTRYVGGGLTALGLVPGRPFDTMGLGLAGSKLNFGAYAGTVFFPDVPSSYTATTLRPSELMLQAYYQLILVPSRLALQGAYTAIPTPGYRPGIPWANTFTLRVVAIL